ncbi:hypothetical protein C1645_777912 [Glomus cerebriforme]|uniref:HMG box domain-containing protein n=1 Tax=Glomus cerebriforme TaxID=658196 RepID=A0A397SRA7_9GLOM|nr:hypothetical protein C1645_777912 [Glomus cerebriforme]
MNSSSFPQVRDFLKKCNLLEYYDRFISEGFDQLQSLLDVTEADLKAMNVKRGHRRRLQREIATIKGIPLNTPLFIQGLEDSSDAQIHATSLPPPALNVYMNEPSSTNGETPGSSQPRNRSTRDDDPPDPPDPPDNGSGKRKYKRHPKRDKNAPVKPLSAYVMFAHKVREEYAGQTISFPDMAKIVGDRWKNVRPEVKEAIENEAAKKKEEYQAEMAVYKTTESWKKYQEYLKEFKEKYESNPRDSNKRTKRQKTEPSPDSDNATPSGYSSTRSASVGYDNGSGNTSSGSSNGNGNGNGNGHNTHKHNSQHHPIGPYSNNGFSHQSPHSTNYIPPYTHYNPTVPFGYTSNNRQNSIIHTFITPPSSINTNNTPTTLADLYAKDDSNAGDDQSQPGNCSSSGNGSSGNGSGNGSSFSGRGSSSSRSAERPSFEDSDISTTSSSNSTPPPVFMETDDNPDHRQSRQRGSRNQNKHQDSSQSRQQDDSNTLAKTK